MSYDEWSYLILWIVVIGLLILLMLMSALCGKMSKVMKDAVKGYQSSTDGWHKANDMNGFLLAFYGAMGAKNSGGDQAGFTRDPDSGVTYTAMLGGWVANFPDGRQETIYLNPSQGSDDGVPTVFVYIDSGNVPTMEGAVAHFVMGECEQ